MTLDQILDGWEGYNRSLVLAVKMLSSDQLAWRGGPDLRSAGEILWHIGDGRPIWFHRFDSRFQGLYVEVQARRSAGPDPMDVDQIVDWLKRTWSLVDVLLRTTSVEDLSRTYLHRFDGVDYDVTRQWTIFRILIHDVHHGGQLSELLATHGVEPPELMWFGGHLAEPKVHVPS